jgi:hypothetical protein
MRGTALELDPDVRGNHHDSIAIILGAVDEIAGVAELVGRHEDHLARCVEDLAGVNADVHKLGLVVPGAGCEAREILG